MGRIKSRNDAIAELVREDWTDAAAALAEIGDPTRGPLDEICPGDGTCMELLVTLIPVFVPLLVPMLTNCPANGPQDRVRIKRILTRAIDEILRDSSEDSGPEVNV